MIVIINGIRYPWSKRSISKYEVLDLVKYNDDLVSYRVTYKNLDGTYGYIDNNHVVITNDVEIRVLEVDKV